MYEYVIIGGGRAGASAVEGIRDLDRSGPILLIGAESHLPYDRPPLSKQLWLGKKEVSDIFIHERDFYEREGVEVATGQRVTEIHSDTNTIVTDAGRKESFGKILLATGGRPRRLGIPGAELRGVYHFRVLDDYLALSHEPEGKRVVVIGGGFIGSEIAAALNIKGAQVTMIFPERHLLERIFPHGLVAEIQGEYSRRGVRVLAGDVPASIVEKDGGLVVTSKRGEHVECDSVVVGIGIEPEVELARSAGLRVENGVEVDEQLQASAAGIYAAGDNAFFPYRALGKRVRVEHWDAAVSQGRTAGRNMAGAGESYTYMPYFFSDLFEFGYEAVGEVDSALETHADWGQENETGAVYYLQDGRVRGVMLCNVWGRLDEARALIESGIKVGVEDLKGAIRA